MFENKTMSSNYISSLQVDSVYLSPTLSLQVDQNDNIIATNSSTNATSVLGALPLIQVNIFTNDSTPQQITSLSTYGSYIILVSGLQGYASAQFMLAKSNPAGSNGNIFRMVSATGAYGEELNMNWPANSVPTLFHSTTSGISVQAVQAAYNVLIVGITNAYTNSVSYS